MEIERFKSFLFVNIACAGLQLQLGKANETYSIVLWFMMKNEIIECRSKLTSPRFILSLILSLSIDCDFSDCSFASLFHASQANLAWFQDSSNDDSLLRSATTSSDRRWLSELLVSPRGEVSCCLGDCKLTPSKNDEEWLPEVLPDGLLAYPM